MVGPGGTAAALWCRWYGRLARRPAGGAGGHRGGPPGGPPVITPQALAGTFPGYRVSQEPGGGAAADWDGPGPCRRSMRADSLTVLAEKLCLADRLPPGGLDDAALARWRDAPPAGMPG